MSTDELSPSANGTSEPSNQASEENSIFTWKGDEWELTKKASKTFVDFVYADVSVTAEEELPAVSLELNAGELLLLFKGRENETVKKIHINKKKRYVTIFTSTKIYKGHVKQILTIRNADSNVTLQIAKKTTELFNFIYHYKLKIDGENVPPPDENQPTPRRKRSGSVVKSSATKEAKIRRTSATQLETQHLLVLKNRLSNEIPPSSENRYLALELLKNDYTIRTPTEANVNTFLELIKNGKYNDSTPLMANKPNDSEFYYIFNGNARLTAIKKSNNDNADKQRNISTVNCTIYKELSFDQKLIVNAQLHKIKASESESTILQETKLIQVIAETHKITIPPSSKDMAHFIELMNIYISQGYNPTCIDLIKLPKEILNSIYEVTINDAPIEHLQLSSHFWKIFVSATKSDSAEALQVLTELKNKTPEQVEKVLKKVEINLMEYLQRRGPHDFESEKDAINELTGELNVNKEDLINALKATNWLRNRKRDGANWDLIKTNVTSYFKTRLVYKNAKYVETIDESLLSTQNFIITENQTDALKNLFEKYQNNFTLLMIGNLGEDPPNMPNFDPTFIFTVIIEEPIIIDKVIDRPPQTTTKAYLYLPNTPKGDETVKMKHLSQLVIAKNALFTSTWTLQQFHEIAKYTNSYENILMYNTSLKITQHFLNKLNYYKQITVTGNEELQTLAATCITPVDEENVTDDVREPEEIVNDN